MRKKYQTVEKYLNDFSGETRNRLDAMHAKIFEIAPKATERISYNIPAYFLDSKMIVYFAGYENHVSIYPGRTASKEYANLSKEYSSGKSTLKFPNNKPLPLELIENFIKLRQKEVLKQK